MEVYFFVLLGTISFFIGYHVLRGPAISEELCEESTKSIQYLKFNLVFFVVLALSLFIILKQVILLLPILLVNGMSEARSEMQVDETLMLTGGADILLAYFAKPFAKASLIVLIINSVRTKFSIKSLIAILGILGIYFFSEGGRAVVMDVFFVLFYALYVNRNQLDYKFKKKMKIVIVIIALLPILATIERGSDAFFSIYTYYCGSLQFLSQALVAKADMFNDYLFGLASFQGFIKPVIGALQFIGLEKPQVVQDASDFILDAQATVYTIAPETDINYFYTSFGYAYKDAGILGIVIVHFVFGFMCKLVDNKENNNAGNIKFLAIKTTFFICVLYTMSYFPFGMYLHAMTLAYIVAITSRFFSKKRIISEKC